MAVIQPWRDEALRPTGAPAVGWEVPAFSEALDHTAGAEAVVRADAQGAILWVRSPGADRAAMVYEVPELAAATAARDTAILQARAREQAGVAALWMVLGLLLVGSAAAFGHLQRGTWLIAVIFLTPAVIQWQQSRRAQRRLAADWTGYAQDSIGQHQVTWWLALRDHMRWLAIGLAAGIALVSILGLVLRTNRAAAVDLAAIQDGEVWRLLTGPILHAGPIHGIMNLAVWIWLSGWCAALFGRRVVLPVFLGSMVLGALATITIGSGGPSVGISGGLMGLLGLLSVAAWRWRRHAMPALSRTVLLNLALIAGVGAIGTGIIDNAAHLGGLVGGVLAGVAIVPRDPGPRATGVWWDWADRLAIAVLVAAIGGAGWLVWHASGGG